MSTAPAAATPSVTIITGASDGIGAELARTLARRHGSGTTLVLAARSEDKLQTVAQDCSAAGATAWARPTDVTQQDACRGLIADTVARYGRLDTLVCNAGMSAHAMLAEVPDTAWYEDLMRLNFFGSLWCTHAALPHLKASRGLVVGVSSLAGLVGVPGRTAYCATKFAQTGFFEALRSEVAVDGIGVTIAYPGVVQTEIRRRGYGPDGRPAGRSGLDERDAMPLAECVRLIADGMARRQRDIVMTPKGKLGRWLKLIAPQVVDRMAWAALRKDG